MLRDYEWRFFEQHNVWGQRLRYATLTNLVEVQVEGVIRPQVSRHYSRCAMTPRLIQIGSDWLRLVTCFIRLGDSFACLIFLLCF